MKIGWTVTAPGEDDTYYPKRCSFHQNQGYYRFKPKQYGTYTIEIDYLYVGASGFCAPWGSENPKFELTVRGDMPQFGADAGNVWNNGSNGTVSQRLDNMKEDNLNLIRLFFSYEEVTGPDNLVYNFCDDASDKGMKVLLVFPAKLYENEENITTNYVDFVTTTLDELQEFIDDGTVFGVELCNEEETGVWFVADYPLYTPQTLPSYWVGAKGGGKRYAKYYLAAYDAIKSNNSWSELEIIGGGAINSSFTLIWIYPVLWQNFGSSGEFLRGFIEEVMNQSNGTLDKLPDTISIHKYTKDEGGVFPPEFRNIKFLNVFDEPDENTERTEWFNRLEELSSICNEFVDAVSGEPYTPYYAETEYAYSPNDEEGIELDPIGTSEKAHALYYLRASLMAATMRVKDGDEWLPDVRWKYFFYYHHSEDYNPNIGEDYGFFANGPGVGYSRAIREVARTLHDSGTEPYEGLRLGREESSVWVPIQRYPPSHDPSDEQGYAWCGWKVGDQPVWWGAIWQYYDDGTFWIATPPEVGTRNFIAKGDFSSGYNFSLFKFNFNAGVGWEDVTTTLYPSYEAATDTTTITIPNVDENPTFIFIYQ